MTGENSLQSQIRAAQAARHELVKWKLVIIAVGGGAALGVAGESVLSCSHLIFAILPLACAYIDLLCRNLSVRTKLIARFLALLQQSTTDDVFEAFYGDYARIWKRRSLETIALIWSTLLISILAPAIGITISLYKPGEMGGDVEATILAISGVLGIALSLLIQYLYESRTSCIGDLELPSKRRP